MRTFPLIVSLQKEFRSKEASIRVEAYFRCSDLDSLHQHLLCYGCADRPPQPLSLGTLHWLFTVLFPLALVVGLSGFLSLLNTLLRAIRPISKRRSS